MSQTTPLIITISRELGSGGAYIGHKLAEHFDLFFADHAIITRTAEKLSVFEGDVASHEERIASFWENFWTNTGLHEFYSEAVGSFRPTTAMIFKTESEVINEIVTKKPAVIVGRGAFHLLSDHPNAVHVFLYASEEIRAKRLMEVQNISEIEAKTKIAVGDKERAMYVKKFTKKSWNDVKNYNICIDTGKVGLDNAFEIIVQFIENYKSSK